LDPVELLEQVPNALPRITARAVVHVPTLPLSSSPRSSVDRERRGTRQRDCRDTILNLLPSALQVTFIMPEALPVLNTAKLNTDTLSEILALIRFSGPSPSQQLQAPTLVYVSR